MLETGTYSFCRHIPVSRSMLRDVGAHSIVKMLKSDDNGSKFLGMSQLSDVRICNADNEELQFLSRSARSFICKSAEPAIFHVPCPTPAQRSSKGV